MLSDENIIPGEVDSVLDYLEDNCIGRPDRRGRRRAPRYNVDMWSMVMLEESGKRFTQNE